DCPPPILRENCLVAIEIGNKIRAACPWANIYIPAEHEDFVQKAYNKKYITEKQILEIDCDIIAEQDVIIIFTPDGYGSLQGGRLVEHDFAINECMPISLFITVSEAIDFLTEHHEYDLHYGGER
ncbi:hypothetical protein LCGC14_2564720, partial [marine sediment metagenome]